MSTPDQLQRFVMELSLSRGTLADGTPLTDKQWQFLKLKLYELVFDVESRKHLRPDSGPAFSRRVRSSS